MRPLSVLMLIWLCISGAALAIQLDGQGCLEYAIWSRDLVWAREIGADRELTRASLIAMRDEASDRSVFALLLRDLDRLWVTRTHRYDVMQAVARECIARRGKYEEVSI